jgi:hypothetical protein
MFNSKFGAPTNNVATCADALILEMRGHSAQTAGVPEGREPEFRSERKSNGSLRPRRTD